MTWRLPAEWEPQESLWLVWPRDPDTWPGGRVAKARAVFAQAVRHVAPYQRVDLVVHPDLESDARAQLQGMDGVAFHPVEHQDSWIRDYGPLSVLDDAGHRKALDFRFDAWGRKYESLITDDKVLDRLQKAGSIRDPVTRHTFVLEGGAVETDGQGTFLATESVVAARGQSQDEFEQILHDHLGARKVLWLPEGVSGDDTDGHIDTLTRFVAPMRVVTSVTPDMEHADHRALLVNRERLHTMTDALGRPLEVIDLPLPEPVTTDDGSPLPATHANFLITNGYVLLPTYGGVSDELARQILQACFVDRPVVGLDHRDLIWGFGGIHCLSMQVPAAGIRAPDPAARDP